jgi:oxepin-CoA hydrolase/3-oxo-5,6-dehydrosuberyl-CoA semialdehyde dehydrogenase
MRVLESYLAGRWVRGGGDGTPLLDAATGEEVARLAAEGVDRAGALAYGREVGGPALRDLTFHERAAMLRALAERLTAHRDELYALSACTGATPADAAYDVDGGIGVLFSYASKGRRELPNDRLLVEGAPERLSRGGGFVGQHIATPRPGVQVQINAFNFPVWGPLEKFAPAFLAGMPSLVKPASTTAYVTHRLVELIVASQLLPDGAIQLLCGDAGDLLHHLSEQDVVLFTGSADTARRLRCHPSVAGRAVRFNAEADSLNVSVLGPDAGPGTPEFDLFADQIVAEMTIKAGQRCTAIRRALVPARLLAPVTDAVAARLAAVTVGDPRQEGVRMGPLASVGQRQEVRAALARLLGAGEAAFGDPWRVAARAADPERGAFLSPVLVRVEDATRPEPHEVEAFGPVTCLLPYANADEAIRLAARGRGSLVGSVVTADGAFARRVVLGLAPWHGRVLVLDREDAAESTGHGSPLPALVHGGPGRAGGGEELGGIRTVLRHMQRTALQGTPRVVAEVTGRYLPGAPRREGVHPFRRSLAELRVGDSVSAGPRTVTAEDIAHFAAFTGDRFYAHTDPAAAAANPLFGGIVAHGYLVLALAAGLFVWPDPGPVLANTGIDQLRFLLPVRAGDQLFVTLTAKQITPRLDADYGEVRWDAEVTNQRGEAVLRYDVLTLVAKGGAADP